MDVLINLCWLMHVTIGNWDSRKQYHNNMTRVFATHTFVTLVNVINKHEAKTKTITRRVKLHRHNAFWMCTHNIKVLQQIWQPMKGGGLVQNAIECTIICVKHFHLVKIVISCNWVLMHNLFILHYWISLYTKMGSLCSERDSSRKGALYERWNSKHNIDVDVLYNSCNTKHTIFKETNFN